MALTQPKYLSLVVSSSDVTRREERTKTWGDPQNNNQKLVVLHIVIVNLN